MNAHTPNPLPLLAVQNMDVLQAILARDTENPDGTNNVAALAEQVGRDRENLRKSLKKMVEEGLLAWPDPTKFLPFLTEAGRVAVEAWARAVAPAEAGGDGITYIPFDRIDPWDLNPRTQFDSAAIEDMAQSIADHGILQPITVRTKGDRFEVIIGERRRRGAARAEARGWVDADFLVPCQVRNWTDDDALDVAGVENLQRHDLHWMDEAKFYLRLAERGRSGAEIARLAGESVSKRKVQDYCKIARELSPEDVARAYLPDDHKDRLLYARARDMVGEKKERPALDLTPKLAMTLGELIAAGHFGGGQMLTRLHKAPVGGPIVTLADRKLVTWRFVDGQPAVAIALSDEVTAWMAQVGLNGDRKAALFRLRSAALGGDLQAAQYDGGGYVTAELNAPAALPAATEATRPDDADPGEATGGFDPPQGDETPLVSDGDDHDDDTDADSPDFLRRLAGAGSSPAPAPAPSTPTASAPPADPPAEVSAKAEPPPLPNFTANLVLEVAHRIASGGVRAATGEWGAEAGHGFHLDSSLTTAIQQHRMLQTRPGPGIATLVCLTPKAWDWMAAAHGVRVLDGRPTFIDAALEDLHRQLMGRQPSDGARYFTAWLNPPAQAPANEPDAGAEGNAPLAGGAEAVREPASAAPASPPPLTQLTPKDRALLACYGQLGQVDAMIGRLRQKASVAQQAEIDQLRKLTEAVRETAKAQLPPGSVQ